MRKATASPQNRREQKPFGRRGSTAHDYPFAAIVGQAEIKLGLILNVIDPTIGGVLMMGHRGTGKSTAVRALADLLPEIRVARDCPFNCEPVEATNLCADCVRRLATNGRLQGKRAAVPVVDLPLGATEDRVCGAIDIQRALTEGVKAFEPGLLARANRGFLYIDEVNLLEDHLVDLLLDVAVTGWNKVERENISVEHPAQFVLIGSGNPEEGELRPQLLDRFGLYIEVKTENDVDERVEIVARREAFDRAHEEFYVSFASEQKKLQQRIARARRNFAQVKVDRQLLRQIAMLCSELKVDGHRGELTIMRSGRALAAFAGRKAVTADDVRQVAMISLRHRLRRDPLADGADDSRIEQALDKVFSGPVGSSSSSDGGHPSAGRANGKPESSKRPDPNGSNGGLDGDVAAPAAVDARLSALTTGESSRAGRTQSSRVRRAKAGTSSYNSKSGRYVRALAHRGPAARVALDATLRLLITAGYRQSDALQPSLLGIPNSALVDSLRFKSFSRKQGALFVFAIDTSGSMALNRISQARGAITRLLTESYINRDRVAIIGFRGDHAEVSLPPSRSISRARRELDSLSVGGGTPLSAALACAIDLARHAQTQTSGDVVLLLFTDGHANMALGTSVVRDRAARSRLIAEEVRHLGSALRKGGVDPIVVDTQNAFSPNGDALALAENLGARYLRMSSPMS